MNEKTVIIDNFFDNIDVLREIALDLPYNRDKNMERQHWKGYRTPDLKNFNNQILNNAVQKILNTVKDIFNDDFIDNTIIKSHFHLLPEHKNVENILNYHRDLAEYSGIVYMNSNPPKNSGTTVLVNGLAESIENKYNRLLIMDGELTHTPTRFFGDNILTGRLALTFFIEDPNEIGFKYPYNKQ